MTAPTVQYRVIVGKKNELVEGPDDAAVVISVPLAEVLADDFDPTVAFMQGRLKSAGSTGGLLELLRAGTVTDAVRALATSVP